MAPRAACRPGSAAPWRRPVRRWPRRRPWTGSSPPRCPVRRRPLPVRVEWEGQRYVVDRAAATRARIERVREAQGRPSVDVASGDAAALADALVALIYASALPATDPELLASRAEARHDFGPLRGAGAQDHRAWRLAEPAGGYALAPVRQPARPGRRAGGALAAPGQRRSAVADAARRGSRRLRADGGAAAGAGADRRLARHRAPARGRRPPPPRRAVERGRRARARRGRGAGRVAARGARLGRRPRRGQRPGRAVAERAGVGRQSADARGSRRPGRVGDGAADRDRRAGDARARAGAAGRARSRTTPAPVWRRASAISTFASPRSSRRASCRRRWRPICCPRRRWT